MVLQCSKVFYFKVSSRFMRQDSQSSYSFGKTQNVGSVETSEEKVSVSLEKDFIFCFHFYIYIYTYIYIYIYYIYIYIYIYECRSIYYQQKHILKNNFNYNFISTLYDLKIFLRIGIISIYKKGQQKRSQFYSTYNEPVSEEWIVKRSHSYT